MEAEKIRVDAGHPYDVTIGSGIMPMASDMFCGSGAERIAIVTDDTVDAMYSSALEASLAESGVRIYKFVFPHGEASKNITTYTAILEFLAASELTRTDAVAALGGGVVGDIAGFAAATYLRGIKYIQIPTTLLAAVDSSVGGKCAVDLPLGKNLVGAFHQPSAVLCDTDTLQTLPDEIFADGCGEVLKYGVLASPTIFSEITEQGVGFDRARVISECVRIKAEIVSEDEFDHGRRALLNLGHTAAHAIERLSDFTVHHGAAVATGCAIAARASAAWGLCSEETAEAVCRAVVSLGHTARTDYTAEELCRVMLNDKKRHGELIDYVVIEKIGKCGILTLNERELFRFVSGGI